jgi:hypothetical protein
MLVLFNPGSPPLHQQWINADQIICIRPVTLRGSAAPLRADQERPDQVWTLLLEMSNGQTYTCEYPNEEIARAVQEQFTHALDGLLEWRLPTENPRA